MKKRKDLKELIDEKIAERRGSAPKEKKNVRKHHVGEARKEAKKGREEEKPKGQKKRESILNTAKATPRRAYGIARLTEGGART